MFFKLILNLAAITMLVCSSCSIAQEKIPPVTSLKPNITVNASEVLPSLQASADVILPDGRNITIHREAQTGQKRAGAVYFHRPLLAFERKSGENTDHPLIWDSVQFEGYTYIQLRVVLSTPEFRELARTAVIEEDPSIHVEIPDVQDRDIKVKPWPIKLLRLEAKHSLTRQVFGVSMPESLRTSGDSIDVSFKVSSVDYVDFLRGLNNDRIRFTPSYTFENTVVAFAQSSTSLSSHLTLEIGNVLESLQIEEGNPIFQAQRDRLENNLNQRIVTTVRTTDINLLAHIAPKDITSQILIPQTTTFEELRSDRVLAEKVEEYLAPIIRKMSSENTDTQENNDINVKTTNRTINGNVGTSPIAGGKGKGPVSVFGGSIAGELSVKNVRTLEDKHKVFFKDSNTRDVIEPHSIEINYLRSSWQSNLYEAIQTIYLAVGQDDSFQEDSTVNSNFTRERLSELITVNDIFVSPHASVPKGVPMFSLRANLPKGWVILDGSTKWPKESWVPVHLRGKPVPDMRGAFVRGKMAEEDVGILNPGAQITIPESEIKGSDFTMESAGTGSVADQIGPIRLFARSGERDDGVVRFSSGRGYGYVLTLENGDIRSYDKPEDNLIRLSMQKMFTGTLSGTHLIEEYTLNLNKPENQPRHVVGQWIMRTE